VKIRHGSVERRVAIAGKPRGGDLSRVLDSDFTPVNLPEDGIALSDMLARILRAEVGDTVEVELLERDRRRVTVPVTVIIQGYLGLGAYMDIDAANRMMREGSLVSGVHIAYDEARREELFARLKTTPVAGFVALQPISLQKFRETLAQNLYIMIAVYVSLGMIIAFGVVYNFARISLSEQGREMASLRVLGLTRGEVSGILLAELGVLTLVAQPVGWLIGRGIAEAMARAFESELFRVPIVVGPEVYAWASLVVIFSALASGLVVRRRIDRLDLIEVLKTRE
jgi:putative ABC transport system permease protein